MDSWAGPPGPGPDAAARMGDPDGTARDALQAANLQAANLHANDWRADAPQQDFMPSQTSPAVLVCAAFVCAAVAASIAGTLPSAAVLRVLAFSGW